MSWWSDWKKRKKAKHLCHVCGHNELPDEPALIELKVSTGIVELQVCDECADFFDKSAEVMMKGRRNEPI